MKKILLITDQPLLTGGIAVLLEKTYENLILKVSNRLSDTTEILSADMYDLLIIKISNEQTDIVEQLSTKWPLMPILVITDGFYDLFFLQLYRAGALGVFDLRCEAQKMLFAISQTIEKKYYLTEGFKRYLISGAPQLTGEPQTLSKLSKRENEVVYLMLTGKNMKDIGKLLNLKSSTICTFRNRIFNKLGISNVQELNKVVKYKIAS